VNWRLYHTIYKRLTPIEHKICESIGITENYLVMFSSNSGQSGDANLKREVLIRKDSNTEDIASSITDFKAFAEVNREQITRMRHSRFYQTLLLKDLLSLDHKSATYDQLQDFYGLTLGDIQAFQ
jgi:hypothetical protein